MLYYNFYGIIEMILAHKMISVLIVILVLRFASKLRFPSSLSILYMVLSAEVMH